MTFEQQSNKNTYKFLQVDPDTCIELASETTTQYVFNVNLKLSVGQVSNIDLSQHHVRVVVKEKVQSNSINTKNSNNPAFVKNKKTDQENSLLAEYVENQVPGSSNVKYEAPSNNPKENLVDSMPKKLYKKIFSGLQSQNDYKKKETFIASVFLPIPIVAASSLIYKYVEMYVPAEKKAEPNVNNSPSSLQKVDELNVDPKNVIQRMNRELLSPTMCAYDRDVYSIDSNTAISYKGFGDKGINLITDYAQYFIHKVPKSPDEASSTFYATQNVSKQLNVIVMTDQIKIEKNVNQNLMIRFDLVSKKTNVVVESTSFDFPLSKHVEAFMSISTPPELSVAAQANSTYVITVQDKEVSGMISGYNFYVKNIDKFGDSAGYQYVGSSDNAGIVKKKFNLTQSLAVVRVVPKDYAGNESAVHSDVVVGSGYDAIGSLTIVVNTSYEHIKVDVYNCPKATSHVNLYRRTCDNKENAFRLIQVASLSKENIMGTSMSFIDEDVKFGEVYEYCAVAVRLLNVGNEINLASNFVIQKYASVTDEVKTVNVTLSNQSSINTVVDSIVSFTIKTNIPQKENETTTNALKLQITELYGQFLNPVNNSNSPLGNGPGSMPEYKDLIMHEVVRTNLNTATREVFPLLPDGGFIDDFETRKILSIQEVNPRHEYIYQIFTYKRNPVELFKKFAVSGTDKSGKAWFYSPYKWKNPQAKKGILYPEDSDGYAIIDQYDSYTAESYGTTASYRTYGSSQFTQVTQTVASRIDVNTVKVSWNVEGDATLFDSFVVMKVVNGIRSFVGNSCKGHIYHQLSYLDIGDVYYIILPITVEFDVHEPSYTNHILITPDGITPISKLFN